MMCFMDKTWCTYWHECDDCDGCHRALTPGIMEKAMEWMENPPICVFGEKPDCFKEKELDK